MEHAAAHEGTGGRQRATLYVVATPVGNLGDISRRALEILGSVDAVAAEDTRVTGQLLAHYGISKRLIAVHEHNERRVVNQVVALLAAGRSLALTCDAGTPGISDPGERLVAAAVAAGHEVSVVPGPVAAIAALVVSGLATERFVMEGFLPRSGRERRDRLIDVARQSRTVILYEAPHRLVRTLADLFEVCGSDRRVAIARELTKLHEEVRRAGLPELARDYAQGAKTRGEIVIVVAPPAEADAATAEDIDALLRRALTRTSVKDAVSEVASATGKPRREIYQRALALSEEAGDGRTR